MNLTLNLNTKGTHMKTRTNKLATLLTAGIIAGANAHAALLEVDFGNGDGKDGQGGFALLGRGAITQQEDWINYTLGDQGGNNRLSTYTTTALSGANALSRDAGSSYTFTSEIRINSMITTQNTRNLSMMLFAENVGNDGIALKLYTGGDGNTFQIDLGTRDFSSDADAGERKVWGGAAFVGSGAVFTLEGTVNFTADDAIVTFRLTDDAATPFTDTVSRTIAKSTLATVGGDKHGISLFHRGTDYDAFSFAVIPEPSTLVLLGISPGSVPLFRRRR